MKFFPIATSWGCLYEKVLCSVILFLVIPCYFVFHMTTIRTNLVAIHNPGPARFWFHFIMSCFCFINTFGNALMSILTDTSLKKITSRHKFEGGTYCEICKAYRPPKSWHCDKCKVCILRRNHHCDFIARCVGMYNQRYYLLYQTYLIISLVYSTYSILHVVASTCKTKTELFFTLVQYLNPLIKLLVRVSDEELSWISLFVFINLILIAWLSFGVYYHWSTALKGMTTYERKKLINATNSDQDPLIKTVGPSELKKNILKIFGSRWYLAIVNPFVDSPVPEAEGTYESDQEKIA
ncbi:hypothetical protein ABMA27_015664 [Loxostege sticticalis]|uniref:Palmitoyltransferase n=1 Tax=Loxostege sticticalis TaxID=481309 RepID=A0ABR3I8I6_LOXSC